MRSLERELAKETGQVSSVLVVGVCVRGGGGCLFTRVKLSRDMLVLVGGENVLKEADMR
jgi:hypothetical protein